MKTCRIVAQNLLAGLACAGIALVLAGCEPEDSALSPYTEKRPLSSVSVEQSTFVPRVTWLGGYVSVLGVNENSVARLDSSLVWLVRVPGNNLRYPVAFGMLPQGGADLTAMYGGRSVSKLTEDQTYTFWVMKEDVWDQVSSSPGNLIAVNPAATAPPVVARNDTVLVNAMSHTQVTSRLDVYVNIKDLRLFGRLADISVEASDTSNRPWISWRVKQAGVTDTLIAAIGVCMGGQYNIDARAWEMVSQVAGPSDTVYFKHNVIRGPLQMGDVSPSTFVSVPFIELIRGQDYYLWMANKDWDGDYRLRSTNYYAFATFKVW